MKIVTYNFAGLTPDATYQISIDTSTDVDANAEPEKSNLAGTVDNLGTVVKGIILIGQ